MHGTSEPKRKLRRGYALGKKETILIKNSIIITQEIRKSKDIAD